MSETDVSGPEAPNPVPEEQGEPAAASTPATTAIDKDVTSDNAADGPAAEATSPAEPTAAAIPGDATAGGSPVGEEPLAPVAASAGPVAEPPARAAGAAADDTTAGVSPVGEEPFAPAAAGGAEATAEPAAADAEATAEPASEAARKRRRRGSRGGRKRSKPRPEGAGDGYGAPEDVEADDAAAADTPAAGEDEGGTQAAADRGPAGEGRQPKQGASGRGRGRTRPRAADTADAAAAGGNGARPRDADDRNPELPDRHREGRPATVEAAEAALVPKAPPPRPKIGDSIPPELLRQIESKAGGDSESAEPDEGRKRRRRRGGRGRSGSAKGSQDVQPQQGQRSQGQKSRRGARSARPVEAVIAHDPTELDDETLERRRGRERKGRAVGRYSMCVHVTPKATQIAVLEGRSLIEHYVSRPSDDVSQIHGNVYLARVQNVLPGMEAAFVDIGTPKNAVLYRGDVHYDPEDVERSGKGRPRIEDVLRAGQTILCQVTKNPIGAKGARLTQEVSLPGRFVVLIPNSSTYGISKRLPDDERKRLRQILDRVKPAEHGVIVRTAAENVTTEEIEDDVRRLLDQWAQIEALAKRSKAPTLLYREPDMAVRVIREEFSQDYRSVLIDDRDLFTAVRDYVGSISPELADRVEYFDAEAEGLPLYERHHVHEQIHRALDRKVWLPSGGSLIVEHTEALTVIDVNTGKNVGRSSLEETVFRNNLEAAVEIARQLRLRDVGGIIVVDFIDMEKTSNRDEVVRVFRDALSRDKTRTQVFEISELGLCEMTRKRIGEGLLESFTSRCPDCDGRGVLVDEELLPD
jgi:ribonuclease E